MSKKELSPYLQIGQVLRPQGIRGQVKVRPDTLPERFEDLETAFVCQKGEYRPVPVSDVTLRGEEVYLCLDNITTRDEAETQRGWTLYVDRAHVRELEENETFIADLIGCEVIGDDGTVIGEITDVMQPGGNDVYVIKTPEGEMLLPALQSVIPQVDTLNGRVIVNMKKLPEVACCSWKE